jgi:uncharacterized protein YndB with AHSA1/START domain
MARVLTAVEIDAPIERVFDYVTTSGNWPYWHPASQSVGGASDHSAAPGERIAEEILMQWPELARRLDRRGARAAAPLGDPGEAEGGGNATITYRLMRQDGGTSFERELVYRMPNAWLAVLDRLFIRRRMVTRSAEAPRRLKRILESGTPPT